jgi:NAD(P)H-hydrate epimerase
LGGRFLGKEVAERYGLDVPKYQGTDQIVEVEVGGTIEKL